MLNAQPRITKVKWDPKKQRVGLRYELPNGGEWDLYELDTRDAPHPDLVAALEACIPHVLTLCELDDVDPESVSVRSVTLTWKNDVMGCVITALRQLQTSPAPLVLNTPHKTAEPYGEQGGEGGLLPGSVIDSLDALIGEAVAFARGKRGERPAAPSSDAEDEE